MKCPLPSSCLRVISDGPAEIVLSCFFGPASFFIPFILFWFFEKKWFEIYLRSTQHITSTRLVHPRTCLPASALMFPFFFFGVCLICVGGWPVCGPAGPGTSNALKDVGDPCDGAAEGRKRPTHKTRSQSFFPHRSSLI